jgi:hypothetical protein
MPSVFSISVFFYFFPFILPPCRRWRQLPQHVPYEVTEHKNNFTSLRLFVTVSNYLTNLLWHFSSRTSQVHVILFAATLQRFHRLSKCLRSTTVTIHMHIVTCGRTVGAQSRQLSYLRFVLLSLLPFGLLIVRQTRQATHSTNVTDHHNIHQTASDPANITFIQYFTSLQTTQLCHIIRMAA